jgi:two-component SAPR family response regulator
MLKAIVVDDEVLVAQWIAKILRKTGKVHVETIIYNPLEVLEAIQNIKPDIIFLDIEMPEITGLELAEQISGLKNSPEIIFITAYNEYALQAFKVNALDYLMKPIDPKELDRVLKKIEKRGLLTENLDTPIHIKTLGGFSISTSQATLKWSTSKCEELFAYLLFQQKKTISKWEIIDILWAHKDDKKGEINLRTTICRLNQTLKKYNVNAKVKSEKSIYLLEIENFYVDAFLLENIEYEWEKINCEEKNVMDTLYQLYPGSLFKGCGYEWSQDLEAYYERRFIEWGKKYIDQRIENRADALLTYKILQYLLILSPFNEGLHERAMKMLFEIEGKKVLQSYYKNFEVMMMDELGVAPKKELQNLYKKLMY